MARELTKEEKRTKNENKRSVNRELERKVLQLMAFTLRSNELAM